MVRVSKNFILMLLFQVWCYENWKSFRRNNNSAIAGPWNTWLTCYPWMQLGSTKDDQIYISTYDFIYVFWMTKLWMKIMWKIRELSYCARDLPFAVESNWSSVRWRTEQQWSGAVCNDGVTAATVAPRRWRWRQRRWWQAADRVEKLRIKNVPCWVRLVSCTSVV